MENIASRCPHHAPFVADVPAEDVARAALDLLQSATGIRPDRRRNAA